MFSFAGWLCVWSSSHLARGVDWWAASLCHIKGPQRSGTLVDLDREDIPGRWYHTGASVFGTTCVGAPSLPHPGHSRRCLLTGGGGAGGWNTHMTTTTLRRSLNWTATLRRWSRRWWIPTRVRSVRTKKRTQRRCRSVVAHYLVSSIYSLHSLYSRSQWLTHWVPTSWRTWTNRCGPWRRICSGCSNTWNKVSVTSTWAVRCHHHPWSTLWPRCRACLTCSLRSRTSHTGHYQEDVLIPINTW